MHGNRRRKKRPSYGVRTVDITKGQSGFGFTISGQAPCILSCIVPGSPAEKAGLRPGDYLIAANGQNISRAPHDDVVRLIGSSMFLKLQIAENYYSDSSDDEFTANRPKPKYPNRLRHKHQQTRAERVVRDLQSGAIFSEHAAIHHSENAPLSDRDWTDPYLPNDSYIMPPPVSTSLAPPLVNGNGVVNIPVSPSTSPTRLRPDQIRLVMAEARQAARNQRPVRDEPPIQPPRPRQTPKNKDKVGALKAKLICLPHQQNQDIKPPLAPQQPNGVHQHHHSSLQHEHQFQNINLQTNLHSQNAKFSENQNGLQHQHQPMQRIQLQQQEIGSHLSQYQQQPLAHLAQHIRQQQLSQQQLKNFNQKLNKMQVKQKQAQLYQIHQLQQAGHTFPNTLPATESCKVITEQDINNFLYPTLAELQQQVPPEDMGETIYRAIVGYLGTIEMPKEPQGGSRLTAIRNCIRRLRIEKKVHTLVLMSIFSEQVVLTNPHGLTLAEYPADRITFCGVYADDKKFFGLVTVHGTSSDELSECSQEDEGGDNSPSISSSCHVFMVDPHAVPHNDHARRAKNFRIECTPTPEDVVGNKESQCLEFPDSADPILHAIMSLYRNRAGFHLETGAPGLIDVDAQMSPPHSNTSSNSSNSDSGIGFRDDGGHHYHHGERVFVVEFDDNQRTRLQNVQIINNLRGDPGASESSRANMENLRANIDNLRANLNPGLANNRGISVNDLPDSNPSSSQYRSNVAECSRTSTSNRQTNGECSRINYTDKDSQQKAINANPRTNITDELRSEHPDSHLRVSVCDVKKLNELRTSLAEGRLSLADGRTSITDDLRAELILEERKNLSSTNGIRKSPDNSLKDAGACTPMGMSPSRECISPQDVGSRLTVRAMPDPIRFERSPGPFLLNVDPPVHVASIRHSMHKYLQHKQEHLVKVSQKINRRESDSGGTHPLSVRAFSPSTGERHTPTISSPSNTLNNQSSNRANIDLSLKLSPKVFGVPFRPSAPSERSFTRSLEDLRDSSTSEGVNGSYGVSGGSFRDGSESDQAQCTDILRGLPMGRLLHASEINLSRCSPTHTNHYLQEPPRGAFRAVAPRSHRMSHHINVGVVPRAGRLMGGLPLEGIAPRLGEVHPMDSADENTETTENTGGPGGSQDVHPPTQDEFSHDSDSEQVDSSDRGAKHHPSGVSSFRRLQRNPSDRDTRASDSNVTHSDSEMGKIAHRSGQLNSIGDDADGNAPIEMSRVGAWASSFEKFLDDPAGLHTFAEFLKKEYSHENIYFWTACERFKKLPNSPDNAECRQREAKFIFDRHLAMGSAEQVNVDSHARQVASEGLLGSNPDAEIFAPAQKQIFNLMKFDSYSRFLKSDLYNNCLNLDRKGLHLPYSGEEDLDPDLRIIAEDSYSKLLTKLPSDCDGRRKSLLPWHRKERSKSKDRGEADYRRRKKLLGHRTPSESSSARSDITDSHTSLNSSDFSHGRRAVSKESLTSIEAGSLSGPDGYSLCRLVLPDQSNSVLAVKSGETVKDLVRQLLERRRILFTTFNVIMTKGDKIIDLNKDSTILGGYEVRIEQMVLFSLYLPSRKTVYVKAKPHKFISEVLKPILTKYGFKLDLVLVHKYGDPKPVNVRDPITALDGEKFVVQTKEEIKEWSDPGRPLKRSSDLYEITNKVFEDVLSGKTNSNFDDLGVLDFDSRSIKTEPSSESSSSLLDSFSRRGSLSLERQSRPRPKLNRSTMHTTNSNGSKQENELYEGLKRAQMGRLDEQRGTEINFELPDFLKDDQSQDLAVHFDRFASNEGLMRGDDDEFFSMAHPEVWGSIHGDFPSSTTNGNASNKWFYNTSMNGFVNSMSVAPKTCVNVSPSADVTLIGADADFDDLEQTLNASCDDAKLMENANGIDSPTRDISLGGISCSANKIRSKRTFGSSSPHSGLEESMSNVSPIPVIPAQRSRIGTSSPFLTPPPPLPPKPKFGGLMRGPPPRPPSRQLQSLSQSIQQMEDSIHGADVPVKTQQMDAFSISFV